MVAEAYVHVVPKEAESDAEWCLSVSYGGTLTQIRMHGCLARNGTLEARLSYELQRLAEALASISAEPSVVLWERPRSSSDSPRGQPRKPPKRAGPEAGRSAERTG
jgi:hypothetical protein